MVVKQFQDGGRPPFSKKSIYRLYYVSEQEAQLSQRDRATLRVIEFFAKSLRVTRGRSK